jgi:hypothetical protein
METVEGLVVGALEKRMVNLVEECMVDAIEG